MNELKTMGPHFQKLVIHKMALLAVPVGGNGITDAIRMFTEKGRLAEITREATEWCRKAVDAVKLADTGKYYGDDDEVIARNILGRIEAKKAFDRKKLRPELPKCEQPM